MNTCCHCNGPICDKDALCKAARPQPSEPEPPSYVCSKTEHWTANYNNCYDSGPLGQCGISHGTEPFDCSAIVPDYESCVDDPPPTEPPGECLIWYQVPIPCGCLNKANGRNFKKVYQTKRDPACDSSSSSAVAAIVNLNLLSTLLDVPIENIENMDYMNLENLKDSKIQETIDKIKKNNN
jgi:hypothetical protein